jgi:phenylalanyl-tRNA synthetase beta subunit (EC 6.1.1.20)
MGMICAEDELGLSDNHDGIMVLGTEADSFAVGAPLDTYVPRDTVFDLQLRLTVLTHSHILALHVSWLA